MLTKKNILDNLTLLNSLVYFLPVSFIMGNLAININILCIGLVGIVIYGPSIFNLNNRVLEFLLYGFFFYIILITLIKNLPNLDTNVLYKEHIFKSFFFLRFLVFLLITNKLLQEKSFDFNLFFLVSSVCVFSVCFIEILNFLGVLKFSLFGDEKISGSYIQRFGLFPLFLINLIFLHSNYIKKKIILNLLLVILLIISIIFSDNRMPLLLFLSYLVFASLLYKKIRNYLMLFLIFFSFSFFLAVKFFPDSDIKYKYRSFYGNARQILLDGPKLFYHGSLNYEVDYAGGHLVTFNSGVETWKKNKVFGGGLKSYRLNCVDQENGVVLLFVGCSTHPHNYILELLTDTGIIGLAFMYLIILLCFMNYFKLYNKSYFYTPFFIILFFEFFPLRSSGSFFSTGNAAYIFFMLAFFINFFKVENLNNKN